ncbi:MAG: hypothetical protein RLZ10_2686 [Bacteroidota bacterium]|jgi:hypothetical protein
MKQTILTETQLKFRLVEIYKEEQFKILEEKWNKLSSNDKKFIIEFIKEFSPKNSKTLKESRWWNTLGDIVGIFDPTGVVDIVNGIDYLRQGDTLFGMMSLISAVPIIGDIVGKPIVGMLKIGGDGAKILKGAKTSSQWVKAAEKLPILGKLFENIGKLGPKLLKIIETVPGGQKFAKLIREWVQMIGKASKEYKLGKEAKVFTGHGTGKWSYLKYMTSADKTFLQKFAAGAPRLFGGNPATRSLLRRSKWFLGLLDKVGLTNFTGTPEELAQKIPDLDAKIAEYNKTPEGQALALQDFKNTDMDNLLKQETPTVTPTTPTQQTTNKSTGDVIGDLFNLIGGPSAIGKLI